MPFASGTAYGARGNLLQKAQTEFRAKNYDEAIALYRKHLRANPRDYNTWNQLAASYYHTGLPDKAIKYLKRVERRTSLKSYNYYYQGLVYTALGSEDKARNYYQYASRYQDEYASRAVFELAVLAYNAKQKDRARYWLDQYMRRFPTGVFRARAAQLMRSLAEGTWIKDVEGNEKPDMEKALYRYSKLSLMDQPHFWFVQTGYLYEEGTVKNPQYAPNAPPIKNDPFGDQELRLNAGFGIGPLVVKDATGFLGYTYNQGWGTSTERINAYFAAPEQISYFPFRPDLLERRHKIFFHMRQDLTEQVYFGLQASYEIARIGSSLIGSNDNAPGLDRVLGINRTSLVVPLIGYRHNENYETVGYFYMKKDISDESVDFSNKTYDLGLDSEDPAMSLGLSQKIGLPQISTEINAELFRYEFIYNDPYLDYTRSGVLIGARHDFIYNLSFEGLFGFYKDEYQLDQIRVNTCKLAPKVNTSDPIKEIKRCPRLDEGLIYQVGLSWNYSQFDRISGYYNYVENTNPELKIFDKTRNQFVVMLTFAFPNVRRVTPFLQRFGDAAFTKEAE